MVEDDNDNVIIFPSRKRSAYGIVPIKRRPNPRYELSSIPLDDDDCWQSAAHMLADVLQEITGCHINPKAVVLLMINDDGSTTVLRRSITRLETRGLFAEYLDAVDD